MKRAENGVFSIYIQRNRSLQSKYVRSFSQLSLFSVLGCEVFSRPKNLPEGDLRILEQRGEQEAPAQALRPGDAPRGVRGGEQDGGVRSRRVLEDDDERRHEIREFLGVGGDERRAQ